MSMKALLQAGVR